MKRRIVSSSQMPTPEEMMGEVINAFYHAGYDVSITDNWFVTCRCTADEPDKMPTIKIVAHREDDEDTINFDAQIKFPELYTADDSYYDSTEYHLNRWAKVGRAVTSLVKNSIHLSDWVDE